VTYLIDKSAWARGPVGRQGPGTADPGRRDRRPPRVHAQGPVQRPKCGRPPPHPALPRRASVKVPHSGEDWRLAELLQRELARVGKHRGLGVSDLLLAATAITHGLVVLHHDRDFLAIAEVSDTPRQQPVVPLGSL
jgi:hypothetical protein